jgi:predicted ATPase/DNA-binding winged helix-turn-helix (wHTH) protein
MGEPAICFGPFRLVVAQRRLLEGDKSVRLGSRAFDILTALVERAGEVVSKEELIARVWPRTFVDETNLKFQVSALRRALGDGQGDSRYIATVVGRGYNFVAQIREEEPPQASVAPTIAPTAAHNLPFATTRMIGREEIATTLVVQLMDQRLVTVVGPGGIGKTTLSLAVGERLIDTYQHGLWMVDLAPLRDPGLVPSAVATVLGLEIRTGDPIPYLVSALRERRMLLLLDNCEHVIDAAAGLVAALLSGTPGITVLATSREPLGLHGEHVHRLAPLHSPELSSGLTAAEAAAFPAVQLFVGRATAIVEDFVLTDDNASVVVAICRRLDGLPLAIEFAAALVEVLGIEGLAAHLDDSFRLFGTRRRAAVPRHRTMQAVIDWSYSLLSEDEQRFFRAVGIFAGGFTSEATAAVVAASAITDSDAIDRLANLVAKSLVVADVSGAKPRFRLLDMTRAYARQKLAESDEGLAISRRHATHFLNLLEPAEADWEIEPKATWLEKYAMPIDDLRVALDWAFGRQGDARIGILLTSASAPLWFASSLLEEYCRRAERALEHIAVSALSGSEIEMKLELSLSAAVFSVEGPSPRMATVSARALEIAELRGNTDYQLRALWQLVRERYGQGDYRKALMFCERFERVANASRDEGVKIVSDRSMALALHLVGRQADARPYAERAVTYRASMTPSAHRAFNEYDNRVASRVHLARILWVQGFPDQAATVVAEGVDQALLLGDPVNICYIVALAACPIAFWNGDTAAIVRYMQVFDSQLSDVSLGYWQTWRRCYHQITALGAEDGTRDFARRVGRLLKSAGDLACIDLLGTIREALVGPDAIARAESEQCGWCAAEVLRAKGAALLRRLESNATEEAEQLFQQSLALAARQGALSWELRSAMNLARLWLERGHRHRAHGLLGPVYARFSEGFETVDLKAAKHVLRELAN